MATFDINAFKTEIWNNGVIRPHSYYAFFGIPNSLRRAGFTDTKQLSMRCESASLPDVTLGTQEILRYGYGPMESAPYTAVFTGATMTFVLDRTSRIYRYFYLWLNTIVNFNTSNGMDRPLLMKQSNINSNFNNLKPYEVGYKDDITTDIVISVQDEFARPVIQTTLYKAYPKAMNAIDLNWASQDDVVKVSIPFTFRDFSTTMYDNPQPLMSSPESKAVEEGTAPKQNPQIAAKDDFTDAAQQTDFNARPVKIA